MRITISGRNIELTEGLKQAVEEVYQNTGDVDVKSYLRGRKRRRQV